MGILDSTPDVRLGPSDNVALDQPRVTIELFTDATGTNSLGPEWFNFPFLLDTGANSIMAMAQPLSEMIPKGYQTEGEFVEYGIGGEHPMDISKPYRFDFSGSDFERITLRGHADPLRRGKRLQHPGPVGTRGDAGDGQPRDHARLRQVAEHLERSLGHLHGHALRQRGAGQPGHRYSVPVDNRISFDPTEQVGLG